MQPNACAVRKLKDDMMPKDQDNEPTEPRQPQTGPPPTALYIIYPALQVGGLTGMIVTCYPQLHLPFDIYT